MGIMEVALVSLISLQDQGEGEDLATTVIHIHKVPDLVSRRIILEEDFRGRDQDLFQGMHPHIKDGIQEEEEIITIEDLIEEGHVADSQEIISSTVLFNLTKIYYCML